MGSCVSVHKHQESAMKFRVSFGSKTDKLVISSPVKDIKSTVNADRPIADVGLKSQWSPGRHVTKFQDVGSIEETFFDSQTWLESDCEDDFLSVNGDFTPSRGNTPVHQSFSMGTPKGVNIAFSEKRAPGSQSELSPTDKKMKLGELLNESLRNDQDVDEQNISGNGKGGTRKMEGKATHLPPVKAANRTPYASGTDSVCSSERTPNGVLKPEETSVRSMQCCLPRLRSSRSFSERNKKTSPAPSIG